MQESNRDSLQDILDVSIVFVDTALDGSTGFWRSAHVDAEMACSVRRPLEVHVLHSLSRDYDEFADQVAERHEHASGVGEKPARMDRPNDIDDAVAECTPQFILRNIPKVERYYDLERSLPFEVTDMPIVDAKALLDEVSHDHLDEIQYIEGENLKFINDFRVFLEEVIALCPWDQISRKPPTEDSPWHLKNSATQLARELLERKNTLFVFGTKGMTKMQMRDFDPEKEKKKSASSRSESGFGMPTFGPG